MRLSNGLSNKKPAGNLETYMPTFLRASSGTAENSYSDVVGSSGAAAMQNFFENEPRHMITTRSGAAIFAPRVSGDATQAASSKSTSIKPPAARPSPAPTRRASRRSRMRSSMSSTPARSPCRHTWAAEQFGLRRAAHRLHP